RLKFANEYRQPGWQRRPTSGKFHFILKQCPIFPAQIWTASAIALEEGRPFQKRIQYERPSQRIAPKSPISRISPIVSIDERDQLRFDKFKKLRCPSFFGLIRVRSRGVIPVSMPDPIGITRDVISNANKNWVWYFMIRHKNVSGIRRQTKSKIAVQQVNYGIGS